MKKIFAILLFSLLSVQAWAGCTITNRSLPEVVIKQLELECLKAEESNKALESKTPDPEKISKYAGLATEVATAIGAAAKNLGVEINNFITTPAGILITVVILTKIFGKLLLSILAIILVNLGVFKIMKRLWIKQIGEGPAKVTRKGIFRKEVVENTPIMKQISWNEADGGLVVTSAALLFTALFSTIIFMVSGF